MILSVRNPGIEMNSSSWKRFEDGNDFVPENKLSLSCSLCFFFLFRPTFCEARSQSEG